MNDISDTLLSFSNRHDLWTLTRQEAFTCLNNYFEEAKSDSLFKFSGLCSDNFILKEKSQELIFWQYGDKTFIARTSFSLFRDNSPNFEIGEYSLDVDINGEMVDDWLIFH